MEFNLELFRARSSDLGIVWLFATLGRHSRVRKVSKRDIEHVDIQAACRYLLSPKEQLPLRITSQFMSGIARVYVTQAESWIKEVVSMHASVRRMVADPNSDQVDLPSNGLIARKDTITLRKELFAEELMMSFERALDLVKIPTPKAQARNGDDQEYREEETTRSRGDAGERTGSHRPFIVSLQSITLPSTPRLMHEDEFLESELGVGLDWSQGEEAAFDLGLFGPQDLSVPQPNDGLPLLDGSLSITTISLAGRDEFGAQDPERHYEEAPMDVEMLPLEEMPPLEDTPVPFANEAVRQVSPRLLATTPMGTQSASSELNTDQRRVWELARAQVGTPLVKRARRPLTDGAPGPLFDPFIDMLEGTALHWNKNYFENMGILQRERQLKDDEKIAPEVAQLYIDGAYDFPKEQSAITSLVKNMHADARFNFEKRSKCGTGDPLHARKRRRMEEEAALGQNRITTNEQLFDGLAEMPPLEDMPPLGFNDDLPPMDAYPAPLEMMAGNESNVSTASDLGVGRDSGSGSGSYARENLPWNMPSMFERIGSEVPASLSGTPQARRISSLSQASPHLLALGTDSYPDNGGDITGVDGFKGDAEEAEAGNNLSATQAQSGAEQDNFFKYLKGVASTFAHGNTLFFSDVAPISDASPSVAAQGFYNVLALITAGKINAKQEKEFGEITITLPAGAVSPTMKDATRGNSRGSSRTSSSNRRLPSPHDASLSAYLPVMSPGESH